MQAQQAILTFSEAEKPIGDRLLKIATETDRVEGYSELHAIAIARMAEKIGARMGLHGVDLTALKFAALAHDLGERAMKRNYLLRPSVLSWEETLDLWRHPILGEQAAGELKLSRQTQLLIRWHHEWWNGGGYPDGLVGEAIPVGARILRAVDSYFAIASDRPHRQRFDRIEAEQIVADLAGIEFDPQVVKLLLQILAEERSSAAAGAYSEIETAATFFESEGEDQPETQFGEPGLEYQTTEIGTSGRPDGIIEREASDEIAPTPLYADPHSETPVEALNGDQRAAPGAELSEPSEPSEPSELSGKTDQTRIESQTDDPQKAREKIES